MKSSKTAGKNMRRPIIIIGLSFGVLFLFLYRLAALPTGKFAPAEAASNVSHTPMLTLLSQPFYLPLSGLRWIGTHLLPSHPLIANRLPSVCLAFLSIAALTYIIRRWYGQRTMFMGLALIATSAWMLHVGRLATSDIAYLAALPILIAANLLLREYTDAKFILHAWVFLMTVLLYIPGMLWFVAISILWQRSELGDAWADRSWLQRLAVFIIGALVLAPFAYGFAHNLDGNFILAWLGLPAHLPTWQQPLKNLAAALLFVFVRTPADPERWLGRLPLLDAFMTISFVAGVIFYAVHWQAERTKLLLTYGVMSLVLCAVGGPVARSLLVPLVYLVAVGGIAYILHEWLRVFPRNPLARRLGIGLVCLAVALSCLYNLRHYFVAWPHNKAVQSSFSVLP